ncbi:MAG TPA: hypothetical protein VNU84_00765 [Candidatus Acidoferrum sp.]|jgi:hypothetical protein|nr:hypothetical protein [Candidatus Acidoferrum sp.]
MTERTKIQIFVGLVIVAVALYLYENRSIPTMGTVLSADTRFEPLKVEEPALQLDRLKELQKSEYAGMRRNIFVAGPVAPPPGAIPHGPAPRPFVGPEQPTPTPPPPPPQVAGEFFGIETSMGRRTALIKEGEDVVTVPEGGTFENNRFRLTHIGNASADVVEVSTGRSVTIPLIPQTDQGSSGAP